MARDTQYTIDTLLALKASAAVAASAAGSLIVDLGAGQVDGDVLVDVSAMDIASNDEIYDIVLQGSPDAAFGTAGNIRELVAISLGCKEAKRSDSDRDDEIGRYVIPFRNNMGDGTNYRYVRIYTVVVGTTPTITYRADICKARL